MFYLRRLGRFLLTEMELLPVDKLCMTCAEILFPEYFSPVITPLVPTEVFEYVFLLILLVYVA